MPAPATEARTALKAIIEGEFATEFPDVRDDHLHESLGRSGPVAGLSPEGEREGGGGETQETDILVQLFGHWEEEVDPEQAVDPAPAEEWSYRLKQAIHTQQETYAGTARAWFFRVVTVDYPKDPTGNKTRLTAIVRVWGQNPALRETTG